VFDVFAGRPGGVSQPSLGSVRSLLEGEHYDVKTFQGGSATLANFDKMAGAGVIVINTHGFGDVSHQLGECDFSEGPERLEQIRKIDPKVGRYAPEFFRLSKLVAHGRGKASERVGVDPRIRRGSQGWIQQE
jgi:hypothetical protein